MDYKAIGLKAGIEIHQQLDTAHKLFCACPTRVRAVEEHNGEFQRYLRATESEMGEIDRAAEEEMKQARLFTYYAYDSTCLVENDDEPPAPLNEEALGLGLTIAKLFAMTPIPQVHIMRKLVIDGSNTSGFQRTGLVAINGILPNGGTIESLCLEEEAAQRVEGPVFSLDRLGIPLVEITTSPCMHTPEEVAEVAAYIGMVLRSTGQVKRGIGTIRQDINISIPAGARVEIKGVQELDLIAEVVRREVQRQQQLLWIRDTLIERKAVIDPVVQEVTDLFKQTGSAILKKAKVILAIRLFGFCGLVGHEIQPGRRLGSELSDYAKKCGVGGIFHTDELPAYGVTVEEKAALIERMDAGVNDAVILVAADKKRATCAVRQVIKRAEMAFLGVPEETRKMLEEGSSAYMRPLPGAARMYPETDVLPVPITAETWEQVSVPELLSARAERFHKDLNLDPGLARQIAFSERLPLFEQAIGEGLKPTLAARTLLSTLKELSRDGVAIDLIGDDQVLSVLHAIEEGKAAKEAISDLLRAIADGTSLDSAIEALGPSVSRDELAALVSAIVAERKEFVAERGMGALGPLMGIVMEQVRGSVDGKVVSALLREELKRQG